jgi:hypothetical protein
MITLFGLPPQTRFKMLFIILHRTMNQAKGMFTIGADNDMNKKVFNQLKSVEREMNKFEWLVMQTIKPEKRKMYKELGEDLSVLYYDLIHDLHSTKTDKERLAVLQEVDKAHDPAVAVLVLKLLNMGELRSSRSNRAFKDMTLREISEELE